MAACECGLVESIPQSSGIRIVSLDQKTSIVVNFIVPVRCLRSARGRLVTILRSKTNLVYISLSGFIRMRILGFYN